MRILFVGPNASKLAQATGHGDVAAARWSYGLLRALADQGHEIVALTHTHERIWPRGEKLWRSRDERYFPEDWPCVDVSYPAVYKLREKWLDWSYPRKARKLLRGNRFDAVLLYNCMETYQVAVQHEAVLLGTPVFPIILDGDDPRCDNWAKLTADTRESAGVVFLSYWATQNYPGKRSVLHLDGGAEKWNGESGIGHVERGECAGGAYTFVHTGALDKWRGLEFMKSVARLVDERQLPVRIVLCGRILPEMKTGFCLSNRVEMLGYVSDQELDGICRRADGFLNVREPSVGDNILNYPSKLPRCLSYGKPVVSTWVESFSSDYHELLWADGTNTPEGFVAEMENVMAASISTLHDRQERMRRWFESSRTWQAQARRLTDWMTEVISES